MKPKHQRLVFVIFSVVSLCAAVLLVLNALRSEVVFFYAPSELSHVTPDTAIRLGGLVETGSVIKDASGAVRFTVTDSNASITVHYTGMLPTLFREGQGVVAEGALKGGEFFATRILAKHDENYMPPEVADSLKKQGHWKGKQ